MATQLAASGSALASVPLLPALITKRNAQLIATGSVTSQGHAAAAARILPKGGLTDLGVWANTQPDTAMTRDMGHQVVTETGTAARGWLTASAPSTYQPAGVAPLWNAAAYAGLQVQWANIPNGQQHALGNVQMESVPSGNRLSWDATSWEGVPCYSSQSNVSWCTVVASDEAALSGKSSGKITYTGAPANTYGYYINPTRPVGMAPCVPGEYLSGSVSVKMERAAWWSAGLQYYDENFATVGSVWYTSGYQQHPGGGAWDTSYVFDIPVLDGASYIAVVPHICINSAPDVFDNIAPVGEVAYVDMHRIWARPYNLRSAPTPYESPRKITVNVKANRVNLFNNPSVDASTFGWGTYGFDGPFPGSWDGSTGRTKPGAYKYSLPADTSGYTLGAQAGIAALTAWSSSNIGGVGWKPLGEYTTSVYVKLGPNCPNVTLDCGYPAINGVLTTDEALSAHPELVEGDWIRLWGTFRTEARDNGVVALYVSIDTPDLVAGEPVTFWIDDALSESGDQLLPYFDGDSPGSDYLWAGTPGQSSSHYYREFRANAYRLKDIVQDQVPHGTQVQLKYAQPLE